MKRKLKYYPKRYNEKKVKDSDSSEDEEDVNVKLIKNLLKKVECMGNHIWFNDDVNNKSISQLIKIIHGKNLFFETKKREAYYAKMEPKPLYLHINSYGGDLQEGMAGVDCIRNSKIPIYTIIEGQAASAATFLSVAGKKRYITENSILLIHQLSAGAWGKMDELEDEHQNNKFFMEKIYSLYSKYTTVPIKKLEKIMKRDIWWDSKKAIKYGFVDSIYRNDID